MNDKEVRIEVCKVFIKPMGLIMSNLENGEVFPFKYLQRTGAGSCTLCVPSVASTFSWNGKQVASLAKSGGYIYILAGNILIPELLDSQVGFRTYKSISKFSSPPSPIFDPRKKISGMSSN